MQPATSEILPIATTKRLPAPSPESGAGAVQALLLCPRLQLQRVLKATGTQWDLPETEPVSPQTLRQPSASALVQRRGRALAFA